MRKAVFLTGVLVGVVALTGCASSPTAPETTAPAVETTTAAPPETSAPPTTPTPTAAVPSEWETEPAGESSLPPVEQPVPAGGPWTELGVTLRSGSDVIQQTELPESFRDFLVSKIGVEDEVGCTLEEVEVLAVHDDGFVYGIEESSCGGAQTVWGIAGNQWNYIVAFLDAVPCADIAYNNIPAGAPGLRCLAEDGSARDY